MLMGAEQDKWVTRDEVNSLKSGVISHGVKRECLEACTYYGMSRVPLQSYPVAPLKIRPVSLAREKQKWKGGGIRGKGTGHVRLE
ncbi:hypothetical protein Pmani_010596 [Petrolisthes manimaculis]|uniref:Uncharacterized protein n=1 Tax=Petrolisthes manimaculis TaxID=1843537 RepID=A0AAE1Q2D0_9EUCA|nr:hypothetical protein Pmani_010596 [Petrolisthes manimaculis]